MLGKVFVIISSNIFLDPFSLLLLDSIIWMLSMFNVVQVCLDCLHSFKYVFLYSFCMIDFHHSIFKSLSIFFIIIFLSLLIQLLYFPSLFAFSSVCLLNIYCIFSMLACILFSKILYHLHY